jgi:glutathione S-transferase
MNVALGWSLEVDHFFDFRWQQVVMPELDAILAWLDAYRRRAPALSDKEIALFPLVCAAIWPTSSCGFVPYDEQTLENCEHIADYMRHMLDRADAISKAIR